MSSVKFYKSLENLMQDLTEKNQVFALDSLLAQEFPHIFEMSGVTSLSQHLYTIPEKQCRALIFFVMWDDMNRVEGFAMMENRGGGGSCVKNLCRNRKNQDSKGKGKHLLGVAEQMAFHQGQRYLFINAENTKLADYYVKLGYQWEPQKRILVKKLH